MSESVRVTAAAAGAGLAGLLLRIIPSPWLLPAVEDDEIVCAERIRCLKDVLIIASQKGKCGQAEAESESEKSG